MAIIHLEKSGSSIKYNTTIKIDKPTVFALIILENSSRLPCTRLGVYKRNAVYKNK